MHWRKLAAAGAVFSGSTVTWVTGCNLPGDSNMSEIDQPLEAGKIVEEPPPIFRSWGRVYRAVALYLLILIAVLYAISREFRY